jgi:tetratricopeptide (TPR) repeat protein
VAVALGNLATTLRMRGRPAEAEPLYRRALEIDEKVFGSEHPHVSRDLNALAVVLRSMSRSEEAEALYLRALKIDEAAFGPDHWRLAIMLNNLANLIADARQPDRAEPYLRRALTILAEFQQETGHQNPYTDDCLRSYIRILRMMGLNATQVRARLRGISPVLESIVDPYIPR